MINQEGMEDLLGLPFKGLQPSFNLCQPTIDIGPGRSALHPELEGLGDIEYLKQQNDDDDSSNDSDCIPHALVLFGSSIP